MGILWTVGTILICAMIFFLINKEEFLEKKEITKATREEKEDYVNDESIECVVMVNDITKQAIIGTKAKYEEHCLKIKDFRDKVKIHFIGSYDECLVYLLENSVMKVTNKEVVND